MRNLYFSNAPAGYRYDFYRALARKMDCALYFEKPGDTTMELPIHGFSSKDLLSLVKQFRPEVVFVPEFSTTALRMLLLGKRFGFRVISFCDDSLDMIRGNDFSLKHRFARQWLPRFLDGVITLSPSVSQWYRNRFGLNPLWMPLIVYERRLRPDLERVLPRSEFIRISKKPVVAFVGRFVELKNIPTLIKAFQPLKDRAQLVLIGDGPQRAALEAIAPDALFTGMLAGDELLAWYNLIDILALPSTQEAYGAVTGEALMAGAKVVVSRKAGSADLVREGENGFVVDPMDVAGFADRIRRLLDEVPSDRPLTLRENLLPYRFETCIRNLLEKINAL